MCKVEIQTLEPASTREATETLVKILNITYANTDLKDVAYNTTHMNTEERTQLLRFLEDSEDLFGGTLGDWDTETVDLELNSYSKLFNFK